MSHFDECKSSVLQKLQQAIDKSPKGSLDAPIVDLIHAINGLDDYVCSMPAASVANLISNSVVEPQSTVQLLRQAEQDQFQFLEVKCEPFILHVQCRAIESAKAMLQVALQAGFRESGIVLGRKIMVHVRTIANSFSVPFPTVDGTACVPNDEIYLLNLIKSANNGFERNATKTERFCDALRTAFPDAFQLDAAPKRKCSSNFTNASCPSVALDTTSLEWNRLTKEPQPVAPGLVPRSDCHVPKPTPIAAGPSKTDPFAPAQDLEALGVPHLQRWGHSLTLLPPSAPTSPAKVVVFGGYGHGTQRTGRLNDLIIMDVDGGDMLRAGTVLPCAQSSPTLWPQKRMSHAAATLRMPLPGQTADGTSESGVLVFGGRTNPGNALDDLWCMRVEDIGASLMVQWQQLASVKVTDTADAGAGKVATTPAARWGHTLTAIPREDISGVASDEQVYALFGGRDGKIAMQNVWLLQVTGSHGRLEHSWRQLATTGTPPTARWSHCANCVVLPTSDGPAPHLVVFGGHNKLPCPPEDEYELVASNVDPHENGGLEPAEASLAARQRFQLGIHVLNLATGEWTQPNMVGGAPSPRFAHTSVVLPTETIAAVAAACLSSSQCAKDVQRRLAQPSVGMLYMGGCCFRSQRNSAAVAVLQGATHGVWLHPTSNTDYRTQTAEADCNQTMVMNDMLVRNEVVLVPVQGAQSSSSASVDVHAAGGGGGGGGGGDEVDGLQPRSLGGYYILSVGGGGLCFSFGTNFSSVMALPGNAVRAALMASAGGGPKPMAVQHKQHARTAASDQAAAAPASSRTLAAKSAVPAFDAVVVMNSGEVKQLKTALEKDGWFDRARRIVRAQAQECTTPLLPLSAAADSIEAVIRADTPALSAAEVTAQHEATSVFFVPIKSDAVSSVWESLSLSGQPDGQSQSSLRQTIGETGWYLAEVPAALHGASVNSKLMRAAQKDTALDQLRVAARRIFKSVESDVPLDTLLAELPTKFERVGEDVLLLAPTDCASPVWHRVGDEFWPLMARACRVRRIMKRGEIVGPQRRPAADLLWASSQCTEEELAGWATIRENGLKYSLNLTRLMFSSGNVTEKARMARQPATGETVVDLFCGIGYFTIPLLVHGGAAQVLACDWNPDAVEAITRNAVLNGVSDRLTVVCGDNREVTASWAGLADRVMLGLIPSSRMSWDTAIRMLKRCGGVLHVHGNVRYGGKTQTAKSTAAAVETASAQQSEARESNPEVDHDAAVHFGESVGAALGEWGVWVAQSFEQLAAAQRRGSWRAEVLHVERVKSYAPMVYHAVVDIRMHGQ